MAFVSGPALPTRTSSSSSNAPRCALTPSPKSSPGVVGGLPLWAVATAFGNLIRRRPAAEAKTPAPPPPLPDQLRAAAAALDAELAGLQAEVSVAQTRLARAVMRADAAENALRAARAQTDNAVRREVGETSAVGRRMFRAMTSAQVRAAKAEKVAVVARGEERIWRKEGGRKGDDVILVSAFATVFGFGIVQFFLHALREGDVASVLLRRLGF